MKYSLFSLFFLLQLTSQAQILDPKAEWFDLNDFFIEEVVQERKIRQITIGISNKKDGRIFIDQGEYLYYHFDRNGNLVDAMRKIPLSRGFDTSSYQYSYDQLGKLIKKVEQEGPFHFEYHYQYPNAENYQSIKIHPDSNQNDTLFHRLHQIAFQNGKEIESIRNLGGKVFLQRSREFNSKGKLEKSEDLYLFNQGRIENYYTYEFDRLVGRQIQKDFGIKKDLLWKFEYSGKKYREVTMLESGNPVYRMAFTYRDRLPSAVVYRNMGEKFIRLYELRYEFFE